MSTLFFEGFNISTLDNKNIYLDPKYWSKSNEEFDLPKTVLNYETSNRLTFLYDQNAPLSPSRPLSEIDATSLFIGLSGAKNFSNPPESQSYLKLNNIENINLSSGIYFSFRVQGLNYQETSYSAFPHEEKIISFCSDDDEILTVEAICVTGDSPYGKDWSGSTLDQRSKGTGIGLRIKESGITKVIYDLRIPNIENYDIVKIPDFHYGVGGWENEGFGITSLVQPQDNPPITRFIHLEFYVEQTGIDFRIEGFNPSGLIPNGNNLIKINHPVEIDRIESINNFKFYNRTFSQNVQSKLIDDRNVIAKNYGECFGNIYYDDIAICIKDNIEPNFWVGPSCRIVPMFFGSTNNAQYFYSQYQDPIVLEDGWTENIDFVLDETSPALLYRDGDNQYISSSSSGSIYSTRPYRQLFTADGGGFGVDPLAIESGIGGIRIFSEVRKPFLDTSFIHVYGTGDGLQTEDYTDIGQIHNVTSVNYEIFNDFVMKNPLTNNVWQSGEIFSVETNSYAAGPSGIFGIKKL